MNGDLVVSLENVEVISFIQDMNEIRRLIVRCTVGSTLMIRVFFLSVVSVHVRTCTHYPNITRRNNNIVL